MSRCGTRKTFATPRGGPHTDGRQDDNVACTVIDEEPPRNLQERTGKHRCVRCLADVPADEYLRNDHLCDVCAEEEMKDEGGRMKDE